MTPAARLQASIDLWEKITGNTRVPMDSICGDYFRIRRFIGSKDRADVAERVYTMMRAHARLGWWCTRLDLPSDARTRTLLCSVLIEKQDIEAVKDLYNGRKYHPDALSEQELSALEKLAGEDLNHADMPEQVLCECPDWAYDRLKSVYGDEFFETMKSMVPPATLDVRVNTLMTTPEAVIASLAGQEVTADSCPYSPIGLRLVDKAFLSKTKAFTKGQIEIQDEGSQLLALICGVQPGMQVLDYCAGGGGKTLALAAMMSGKGRIVAMDIDEKRLAKGKPRFVRAGIHNVEVRPLSDEKHRKWFRRQKDNFDVVLVDAPCSSSGTWRRNPDLRWHHYGPAHSAIEQVQTEIFTHVAKAVKPGGKLIYATCSLFAEENEAQVEIFLANHPEFSLVPAPQAWAEAGLETPCPVTGDYLRLSPYKHGTDGFFAAVLQNNEPPRPPLNDYPEQE